jgi:uncharacterized protein
MAEPKGHYPGRALIDAYGGGGFRFADMSHRGSLLILPSGTHAWRPADMASLAAADFDKVIAEKEGIEILLLGTGLGQVFPSLALRRLVEDSGIGMEPMSTGAACRTFNVLLAERRAVAAALIAVE